MGSSVGHPPPKKSIASFPDIFSTTQKKGDLRILNRKKRGFPFCLMFEKKHDIKCSNGDSFQRQELRDGGILGYPKTPLRLGEVIDQLWWFKTLFYVHPDLWGFKISQFDGLGHIFFKLGGC